MPKLKNALQAIKGEWMPLAKQVKDKRVSTELNKLNLQSIHKTPHEAVARGIHNGLSMEEALAAVKQSMPRYFAAGAGTGALAALPGQANASVPASNKLREYHPSLSERTSDKIMNALTKLGVPRASARKTGEGITSLPDTAATLAFRHPGMSVPAMAWEGLDLAQSAGEKLRLEQGQVDQVFGDEYGAGR